MFSSAKPFFTTAFLRDTGFPRKRYVCHAVSPPPQSSRQKPPSFTLFDCAQIAASEQSPSCAAYTNFLLATCALRPIEVAVAAVLPCFTIYLEVGTTLQSFLAAAAGPAGPASPAGPAGPHPYADWIRTYGGADFRDATRRVAALADRLAAAAGPAARAAMRAAFLEAARHEFLFWDAAHRRERWPISLAGAAAAPP